MTNFSKSTFSWILLILLGAGSVWAQTAPTVQWQTSVPEVVSTPSLSQALIANAPNGEYQTIISPAGTNSTLVRLTSTGQFKVARALPGSIDRYQANQLISTQDGGFLLSGLTVNINYKDRLFITKLDGQANTVWNSVENPQPLTPAIPPTIFTGTQLLERSDYFVRFTNFNYRFFSSAYRQHLDKSGNEKSFVKTGLDNALAFAASSERVSAICEAVDGGIIVAFSSGQVNLFKIADTDTSFALPGYPRYFVNGQGYNYVHSVVPTTTRDGYYVIASDLSGDNKELRKINPVGTIIWSTPLAFNALKIVAETDGVVIGGGNTSNQVVLQKLNLTGNAVWQTVVNGGQLNSLIKTPDGGYVASTSAPLFIKFSPEQTTPTPPTGNLALTAPSYDCNTGQLTLNTWGGNGSAIDYRIAGLRDWGFNNVFTVPAYQRNGTTFTLEARQNGQVVSLAFTTACGTTTTPPSTTTTPPSTTTTTPPSPILSMDVPNYDCNTGRLAIRIFNTDGSGLSYRIVGLRDWSADNIFTVPSYQRLGTTFKLEARQASGAYTSFDFTTTCDLSGVVTPQPTYPLYVDFNSLQCATGQLQLAASGGDNSPIEYRIPGLADWQPSPVFIVPTYQRTGTTFTYYARQNGFVVSNQYTTNCPTNARVASPETGANWQVVVMGNPVEDQLQLRLSGLAGQTVGLSLIDATGRVQSERQVSVQTEGQTETISVRGSAGVYLLRAVSNGQQQTMKVLKK